MIRDDPSLCFLAKCGRSELDDEGNKDKKDESAEEFTVDAGPSNAAFDTSDIVAGNKTAAEPATDGDKICKFPSAAELNSRFRRLMSLYQKTSKISSIKEEQNRKVTMMAAALIGNRLGLD